MSDRLLLVDTDILVLLGASGTFSTVLALLNFQAGQTRRLAAATYQLERGRTFKATYAAPALHAALTLARSIEPLAVAPEETVLLDAIASVSGIDLGEALMFALLAEHEAYYLATGDKRAIEAVACEPSLVDVRDRIAGRVICLETILKLVIKQRGAGPAAEAFSKVSTHRTIGIVFSEPQLRTDEVCMQGIDSYLDDLIQRTGEGFLHLP